MSHVEARCIFGDCPKDRVNSRGWCCKHYYRWRKYGDPAITSRIIGDDAARFWIKVDRRGPDECWPWLAGIDYDGYGKFRFNGYADCAHRVAWILTNGAIADGLEIDHTCHDPLACHARSECPHRQCMNPVHLAAVTALVNRGRTIPHGRTGALRDGGGRFTTGRG